MSVLQKCCHLLVPIHTEVDEADRPGTEVPAVIVKDTGGMGGEVDGGGGEVNGGGGEVCPHAKSEGEEASEEQGGSWHHGEQAGQEGAGCWQPAL